MVEDHSVVEDHPVVGDHPMVKDHPLVEDHPVVWDHPVLENHPRIEDHPGVEDHHNAAEQGNQMMRQHVIVLHREKVNRTRLRVLPYSRSQEAFLYKHLSTIAFLHIFTDKVCDLLVIKLTDTQSWASPNYSVLDHGTVLLQLRT